MPPDVVAEILALLGLGDDRPQPPADGPGNSNDVVLAEASSISLWQTGNESAQWIELRGIDPIFRVTRTKARLLCVLEEQVARWAQGTPVAASVGDSSFQILNGAPARLEIRHKDWRPIRLCRQHAQALVLFRDAVRRFAYGGSDRQEGSQHSMLF
jgi:hypothetical protein